MKTYKFPKDSQYEFNDKLEELMDMFKITYKKNICYTIKEIINLFKYLYFK